MSRCAAGAACSALAYMLTGCASFEVVGDPRVGALGRDRLPILVKSVRCELAAFYTAELYHRHLLSAYRQTLAASGQKYITIDDLAHYNYFDLDTDAFSNISLDIKMQDTFGIPGSTTSVNNVLSTTTGNARSLALGPSVQAQATYDDAASFAIPQNASIVTAHEITSGEAHEGHLPPIPPAARDQNCFSNSVIGDYDGLAAGKYPTLELFDRIHVDAGPPLAAWLQEASRTMGISRNLMIDVHAKSEHRQAVTVDPFISGQAIDTGQLVYTFTVQYTGALDAKFSLVTTRLNPLAADLNASIQQTGVLTLYLNGYQALTALSAKSGLVLINPPPTPVTRVFVVNSDKLPPEPKKPEKKVTDEGFKKVGEILGDKSRPEFVGPESDKVSNLYKQMGKNQAASGQAEATSTAIQELKVSAPVATEITKAIENNTVTVVPTPVPPAAPRRPAYSPAPSNDGRGYFRAPIGIPIQ
jgi:hypothetical protein